MDPTRHLPCTWPAKPGLYRLCWRKLRRGAEGGATFIPTMPLLPQLPATEPVLFVRTNPAATIHGRSMLFSTPGEVAGRFLGHCISWRSRSRFPTIVCMKAAWKIRSVTRSGQRTNRRQSRSATWTRSASMANQGIVWLDLFFSRCNQLMTWSAYLLHPPSWSVHGDSQMQRRDSPASLQCIASCHQMLLFQIAVAQCGCSCTESQCINIDILAWIKSNSKVNAG